MDAGGPPAPAGPPQSARPGGARACPHHQEGNMKILDLKGKKVLFGDNITIMVVEIRGRQIKLGVKASADILILCEKPVAREKP